MAIIMKSVVTPESAMVILEFTERHLEEFRLMGQALNKSVNEIAHLVGEVGFAQVQCHSRIAGPHALFHSPLTQANGPD